MKYQEIKPAAIVAAHRRGNSMKRKAKKNPSAAIVRSRAAAIGRRMIAGIDVRKTVTNAVIGAPGPLLAQWAAKKIGEGRSFFEPGWTMTNYAAAVGGAFAAGLIGNMIAPGRGQTMVEHGLAIVLNKALQEQVIARSETLSAQLSGPETNISILDRLQKLRARRAAQRTLPRAARFLQHQLLNPPLYDSTRDRDEYGNPVVSMSGPIVERGSLGGRFEARGSLGSDSEPYRNVF